MIKIKVNLPEMKVPIFVPIPYMALRLITSERLLKVATNKIDKECGTNLNEFDFQSVKDLLKTLKEFRNLTIVDVQSKDGTNVKITL
ncbi:hypothetical protein J5Y03_17795 [Bacillus sp. RG28]|uniref:Uncharacterized protein n=1 Tax=Gottfriedia endophytica TaxID=2820819 RepID=A0A940NM60_9BACI|nr:hypothetical protein [Gottfriedia endophytica]MBP0727015.1 hypothetical protein [Gottfriedia endophytica]